MHYFFNFFWGFLLIVYVVHLIKAYSRYILLDPKNRLVKLSFNRSLFFNISHKQTFYLFILYLEN